MKIYCKEYTNNKSGETMRGRWQRTLSKATTTRFKGENYCMQPHYSLQMREAKVSLWDWITGNI
jgi:hypothetical protein